MLLLLSSLLSSLSSSLLWLLSSWLLLSLLLSLLLLLLSLSLLLLLSSSLLSLSLPLSSSLSLWSSSCCCCRCRCCCHVVVVVVVVLVFVVVVGVSSLLLTCRRRRRGQSPVRSLHHLLCACTVCSADEEPGDNEVLQVPGEARRLAVDAELRHDRAQQSLVATSLHCLRHLRHQVTAPPPTIQWRILDLTDPGGQGQSGQAVKLLQITPYVGDFQRRSDGGISVYTPPPKKKSVYLKILCGCSSPVTQDICDMIYVHEWDINIMF